MRSQLFHMDSSNADDEGMIGSTRSDSFLSRDHGDQITSSGRIVPKRELVRHKALRDMPGVILHVFKITSDAKVERYDGETYVGLADALSSDRQQKTQAYWVHVDADEGDRHELNEWIDQLNLGSFISDQIKRPADEWLSHVASTRSKALLMIRILPDMDKDGRFVAHHVEYLAVVMKNRLLLTYTTSESGRVNNVSVSHESMEYMTQDELLFEGSNSAALIAWLEFHVLRTRKALTTLRKDASILAKDMDLHPKSVQLKDITDIADNLLVVLSVAEEQAQCLAMIKNMDVDTHSVDFTNLQGALSILVKTAESTERMGQRLEKRAKGLKDTYDARQQHMLNRRLAMLTVVSTIFMPLTFIAGVYGMNFENMPELEYENSYFILIGVMFTLAMGMIGFFYHNGWFV